MRTLLLLLISCHMAIAQSGFELEGYWLNAFPGQKMVFFHNEITEFNCTGYSAYLTYSYEVKDWKTTFLTGVTGKKLFFDGKASQGQSFEGNSLKAGIFLGGRYNITEKLQAGLRFVMENNREEKRFRISTSDLFRYNIEVSAAYELISRINLSIFYSKGLYPIRDTYLLFNPEHQLALGLRFDIL